jgi:heme-degrading monooxygenase HmoA
MSLASNREHSATPADGLAKRVVNVSIITPKPGKSGEFMDLQLAQVNRLRGKVQGLLGTRLFRSNDNRTIVLVSAFATAEDSQRFRESRDLTDHLANVRPLIESATAGGYETVYEVGAI